MEFGLLHNLPYSPDFATIHFFLPKKNDKICSFHVYANSLGWEKRLNNISNYDEIDFRNELIFTPFSFFLEMDDQQY